MSMSRRELNMAGFMLAILLILFAFLFTRSKLEGIRANREGIATQQTLAQMRQDRIDQKAQVSVDVERLVGQLPVYPMGKNVALDLFGQIEGMAAKTGLSINKIEVKEDEEEMTDGVYQMKIGGTYDAPSAAVVQFLYLTQSKGGALDVSLYSHKPKLREPGVVEGMFVMDCAYRRKDLSKLPPAAPSGGPVRAAPPTVTPPPSTIAPSTTAPSTTSSTRPGPVKPPTTTFGATSGVRPNIPGAPSSTSNAGTPTKRIDRSSPTGPVSTPAPAGIPPPSGPRVIRRPIDRSSLGAPPTPAGLQRPTIQPTRVGTGTIVPAGTTAPANTVVPGSTPPAGSGRPGSNPINVLKTNPLRPPSLPGARTTPAPPTPGTP